MITANFDPLVFQTPWSNTIVVPFELDAMKSDGITKIGLISDTGGFGKDGREVVLAEAEKMGIEVVSDQTFNPGDTDMTAQLTKIKNSDAQAVLVFTAGKEAATVVKNAKDLGITIPIYGSHGNARREFIEGAGEAAEGFKFAAGKVLIPEAYGEGTEGYTVATDFIDRYTAAFGAAPSTFAGHAYDALYLITEAAAARRGRAHAGRAARRDREDRRIRRHRWNVQLLADRPQRSDQRDLTTYEIKNGDWQLVE